ncbi:M48 family metallopeptidase [Devosia faecipullorum]|uniref:M48 family metallopeptidase n=1 Tax=Devosia faecipullorum TaxID=2755039 RepID=UPI00187B5DA6|nr:M48 family metallopeptidase [Devosia faecipullorum]MBE7733957.1 M48 family metallopeptidase [Devosia faecipullorum]
MSIPARFHDGLVSRVHETQLRYEHEGESGRLLVLDAVSGAPLAAWPAENLYLVPARRDEIRIGANGENDGARVVVAGAEHIGRIRATLPLLAQRQKQERGRQIRLAALSTMALAMVIAAYIFGVPLIATRVVQLVPPGWEDGIGQTVASQIESSLGDEAGLPLCDPNPQSHANRAIARFVDAALDGVGTPFSPEVRVVRSDVANAFALPGGRVYFFSALLNAARTPDEFAAVLAHELGHVVYRHGMEQLVSTAGTGLLVGFILGDMTGISVAAGLGATLIDSRFSREAEHEADRFAADVAQRLDFQPWALANLIGRVSQDSAFDRALALFNTHPLTDERLAALTLLGQERPDGLEPPFTRDEWQAIRSMCIGSSAP